MAHADLSNKLYGAPSGVLIKRWILTKIWNVEYLSLMKSTTKTGCMLHFEFLNVWLLLRKEQFTCFFENTTFSDVKVEIDILSTSSNIVQWDISSGLLTLMYISIFQVEEVQIIGLYKF